ncbi:MAG: branched-chain amino acid ABC transporter permease [Deltaproteobacteria bacterium]|nr:branched-chain amino acid ABC transporter permease [Deltaproteobacteria bacterium]
MGKGAVLRGLVGIVLLFLCLVPAFASDYLISLFLDLLMWIALAESWIILSGYTGYISLGHSAFFGLGAYFMAMTWTHVPYAVSVISGGLVCVAFAFAIGFAFLRVRGPYFVILTLGLSEFTKFLFINLEIKLGGTVGRILMMAPRLETLYYSVLVVGTAATLAAYLVKNSRFGMGLFSIKEDEDAANSLGINTSLYKWLAFGISAFFPGMVGAILALRRSYIDPYTVFNPLVSFQVIVMAFLGGFQDVEGALLGAVVLTLVSEALWARYPYYYMIILGAIIILVVKFMPLGVLHPIKKKLVRGPR